MSTPTLPSTPALPSARVLLVEDEDVIRRILAALVEELGHTVVEARDGEEALLQLDAPTPPDLIIADKNLPGINGLEVLRQARARCPDAQLMMVTGYASYESAVEALRLGVCEYLEKPFLDLRVIQQRITGALALKAERGRDPLALARRLVELLDPRQDAASQAALAAARNAVAALSS